ncbi:DUF6456 domain-containing protein [Hyphobacterium marinum]|uniref:DUF6456 domain-containing protein n=1 Tax=Hyphobacterium marinum TaxID=3116574 RepID=A0ABU7M0N4_9PROT|nr:DUF6456 domain-containing protein [Hyphobacterium sp. Y6023]MEE2567351.1 DUF6456 domain-containing protein [Hyphobacterium sp. Y6023]
MKRLAKGTARLCALDAAATSYGVFPGGDRRRRPMARVPAETVRQARAAGWIVADGASFSLTDDGRAVLQVRDNETDFAARHRTLADTPVMVGRRIETAKRNLDESPLARWSRPLPGGGSPFLTPEEFAAGERFRADYHRSTLSARVTSHWSAQPGSPGRSVRDPADAPVAALSARDRVMDALDALGPGLDRVVMAVCIRELPMDGVERELSWPSRSGKLALKLALQRLALHYGLAPQPARQAATEPASR